MSPLIKHSQHDKDTGVENKLGVGQPGVRNGGKRGVTIKESHHRDLCHDGFSLSPDCDGHYIYLHV